MSCLERHSYPAKGFQSEIEAMAFQNIQENYQKLNESISFKLFKQKMNVRIFQTAQLAAFDVALGLQQYLAHKPQIGICKNGSNLIESLCSHWLRTHTPMQAKTENQSWYEYVENLVADTNFVMWASENEITGEVIIPEKQAEEIHQHLAKKRIFSIQIVHEENFCLKILTPYSILISKNQLFSANSSVVLSGDKVKTPTLLGSFQDLKGLNSDFSFQEKTNEILISEIELQFADKNIFYFNQFATPAHRLTDRVVFYFPDIAGTSLQQKLGLTADRCLTVSDIPFWSIDLWKNWWKEAESEKLIRGLLVISVKAFQEDSALVKKIESAIVEIRSLSTWTV